MIRKKIQENLYLLVMPPQLFILEDQKSGRKEEGKENFTPFIMLH